MSTTTEYRSSSVAAGSWEPLIEDGRETGQVHWLCGEGEGGPLAGLWRISPEEGEFPYRAILGVDDFHVIQGEAELETPEGKKSSSSPGASTPSPRGSRPPGGPVHRS